MRTIAVVACSLLLAAGARAATQFEDSFDFYDVGGSGSTISSGPTITNGVLTHTAGGAVEGSGPLDTDTSAALRAHVNPSERTVGAQATVSTEVRPYDPEHPPTTSFTYDVRAAIEARLLDRVTVRSDSLLPNGLVRFNVLGGKLRGRMSVPPEGAGGTTIVQVGFAYAPVDNPGGGRSFVYEQPLLTGDGLPNPLEIFQQDLILPDELFPIGQEPVVEVRNGRTYDFRGFLRVSAEALPQIFPALDPPKMTSDASFFTTWDWGGFGNFTDENGAPLTDVVLESEDGIDWASPSPAPEPAATLLGGAACVAIALLRRR